MHLNYSVVKMIQSKRKQTFLGTIQIIIGPNTSSIIKKVKESRYIRKAPYWGIITMVNIYELQNSQIRLQNKKDTTPSHIDIDTLEN